MRRISFRFAINIFLLCLPTLAAVGAAVFFYFRDVPRVVENERKRLRGEYREVAVELKEAKEPATRVKNTRGWSSNTLFNGAMSPGEWGCFPDSKEEMIVWYRQGRQYYARKVPVLEEVDFQKIFLVGGSCLLALLFALTILGIRFFVVETCARDDFLAATAHDLTTPLVGLRLLISQENTEAQHSVSRLMHLVDNIKDYLRPGGRRAHLCCQKVDLLAIYEEAYSLFASNYRDLREGEDIVVKGKAASPYFVRADEMRLLQILWNLLGNELKYAAPYGPLEVHLVREKECIQLSFVDVGPGMSPHERQHAFDRYYRSRGALKTGKGGFGIGLCVSREFARLMGGDLTVTANKPQGCVFTLTLAAFKD